MQYDVETEIVCVFANEYLTVDYLKAGNHALFAAGYGGVSKLPINLCDEIDGLMSDFLIDKEVVVDPDYPYDWLFF